jgi:hypothetical protein
MMLDHPATLRVQIRVQSFSWSGAPDQRLTLSINGQAQALAIVPPDWSVLEFVVPSPAWRTGVNQLAMTFDRATRPADVGLGGDPRPLAAAVDYVRVAVEAP